MEPSAPEPPIERPSRRSASGPRILPDKSYCEVALPTSLRQTFTYAVPPPLREAIALGHRVRVRFGPKSATGYVVAFHRQRPALTRIRPILALDPPEALFTPEILELTRWTADYYLAPWGQVLENALPRTVKRAGPRAERADAREESAESEAGPDAALGGIEPSLRPHLLSAEQQAAVDGLSEALDANRFAIALLHGVTGSGKTEVYLELAERALAAGGSVLFLVPEIAMGTQILARVRQRFGERVGLYHSQAGEKTRRQVWRRARDGRLPVVVGARSAVFVPMPKLRLVVIDEEHESAYKQDETPRYHARDTAIVRARAAGALVLLGSATPSLESLRNAELGKYRLLRLTTRVEARPPSAVTLVDMTEIVKSLRARGRTPTSGEVEAPAAVAAAGRPWTRRDEDLLHRAFSPALLAAVEQRLARGEQSILFLNRRGHSTIVQCSDCGQSLQCSRCDVVLTWHQEEGALRCHYCNAARKRPEECGACGSGRFFFGGFGTQRIEELLKLLFPAARVARMDQDATRPRGAHGKLIAAMEGLEVDILLGTQMVAKGFHFPRVTLVGVLHADRELLLPDFRAGERAFQILTQVAGRSGRAALPGEVVLQTLMPEHYAIACASRGDYEGFALRELYFRETFRYPPFHRMVHLLFDGPEEERVRVRAEEVGVRLGDRVRRENRQIVLLGPAPMSLSRLKGQYRWHLTLKGRSSEALHELARAGLDDKPGRGLSGVRVQADVDPLSML